MPLNLSEVLVWWSLKGIKRRTFSWAVSATLVRRMEKRRDGEHAKRNKNELMSYDAYAVNAVFRYIKQNNHR